MRLAADHDQRLPVLLYHHVGPASRGNFANLTVSPENFRRHLQRIARWGYTAIRPRDWMAFVRERRPLPAKPVIFTFDDGYADLAEFAFPLLRQFGFSAVAYLVTSQLGGTNVWDQNMGLAPHPLLQAEQVRYWSGQGIEFGAHGRTHRRLTELSPREVEDEVAGSKRDLEELLGSQVVSFAYPYGAHNDAVRQIANSAGLLSFTVEPGLNDPATNLQRLRRTTVQPKDNVVDLWLRLSFGRKRTEDLRCKLGAWKQQIFSGFRRA